MKGRMEYIGPFSRSLRSVKQFPKVLEYFSLLDFLSSGNLLIIPSLYMIFLFICNPSGCNLQHWRIQGIKACVRVSRTDLLRVVGYKLFPVLLLVPLTLFHQSCLNLYQTSTLLML